MWALTKEEMKNCRWLKPELVAQIEFAEWTPDGHLRHSKFVGLREDKKASESVHELSARRSQYGLFRWCGLDQGCQEADNVISSSY
jgi:ATP-dependent DNA ligase